MDRLLVLVADDSGVPRSEIAQVFGATEAAIHGVVWRTRFDMTQVNLLLDPDMLSRVDQFRGKRTRAAALRELIEWGLEAYENELPRQRD